jgi:N-acetyl-anhydromuramyl-L-alanine amidase AmpD
MKILNFDVMRVMKEVNRIVLHNSGTDFGNAETFHKAHKKIGYSGLGYHYVIGNGNGLEDGYIEVGRPEKWQGSHARGGNKDSIGICLVGNFMETEPTEAQYKSLIRLLTQICFRYNLNPYGIYGNGKKQSGVICGHRDVYGSSTDCPGDKFYEMLSRVRDDVKWNLINYNKNRVSSIKS